MSYEDAINAFKDKHSDAEISSVELEKSLGKYVYKVDGISNDNEYEMKFNAETKEQLSDETDRLDREDAGGVEKENEKLSLDGIKSPKEAMDKAVSEQAGDVTSWKIERELDTTLKFVILPVISANGDLIQSSLKKVLELQLAFTEQALLLDKRGTLVQN